MNLSEGYRKLIELGATSEMIVVLMEVAEHERRKSFASAESLLKSAERPPVIDEQAQRRREADRERKARYREEQRLRMSAESPATKEGPQTPIEKLQPIKPTNAPARGTRLPEDFQPLPNIREMALNRSLSPAEYDDQLERFRDYWRAKSGQDGTKLDWQGTCRNWMKRAADDKRKSSNGSRRPSPAEQMREGIRAIGDHLAQRERQGPGSLS